MRSIRRIERITDPVERIWEILERIMICGGLGTVALTIYVILLACARL